MLISCFSLFIKSKGTELERQNVELQATIQDLEKSNSDLLETLNETVEKLEEASQVKKNMETDFAEAKAEQQNMSDQLENEVKNLQIKVSEQESINCELKATFDETVGHLEEVTSTKDDLEKKLQAAQVDTFNNYAGVDLHCNTTVKLQHINCFIIYIYLNRPK